MKLKFKRPSQFLVEKGVKNVVFFKYIKDTNGDINVNGDMVVFNNSLYYVNIKHNHCKLMIKNFIPGNIEMAYIHGLLFVQTCQCCPEQYDIYYKGDQIGYLRYRYGVLDLRYRNVAGPCIYKKTIGDNMDGYLGNQRVKYLKKCARVLKQRNAFGFIQ